MIGMLGEDEKYFAVMPITYLKARVFEVCVSWTKHKWASSNVRSFTTNC